MIDENGTLEVRQNNIKSQGSRTASGPHISRE